LKVLVIGLDGANLDLIKRWAQEGKLPTFKKFLSEGTSGYLESTIPTLTVPAWNCLTSGRNPGKTGCFSFFQKVYGSYDFRLPSSIVNKRMDVWDILSDSGKNVFILNPPHVNYAYKINGYMVAGPLYVSKDKFTYPSSLTEELNKMNYESDVTDSLDELNLLSEKDLSKRLGEVTEKHFDALYYFLDKKWDFGFVVFSELDRIQHRLWNQEEIILKHYQNIDRKLNDLQTRLDIENNDINIIIVSDHGFGPNKRIFLINEWLSKRGYLELKNISKINFISLLLRKLNLTNLMRKVFNLPGLKLLYLNLTHRSGKTSIAWDKAKVFSYGTWGTIYLNLIGREQQGIVKKEEYEQLRNEIITELQKISVKAHKREELYYGKYLESAPDIIIETDDYVTSISPGVGFGTEFLDGSDGSHRKDNGTFIAWGPDINKNFEVNAKIYDVTPTILHMFGMLIPKDMDGRVLREIFKDKSKLFNREVLYTEIQDNVKDKELIKNKLKILGDLRKI
jgi:predicted AlkP superfamily phosphohydrolase/phosphomutase